MGIISRKQNKGFTLVEILLVVVIIGALSAMIIPRLTGRSEQAKIVAAKADINSHIATALKLYELDNGFFPTTNQGLDSLLEAPNSDPVPLNWNGPYIERKPLDPWGNVYRYASPGRHRPDYDLSCEGKDVSSQEDDISNWE